MKAATRRSDPITSHRAAANINVAQQRETEGPTPAEAVEACLKTLRNFSEREVRLQMRLDYPGPNEDSGSICSFERMRGVLSDLKKAGTVVPLPLEEGAKHVRFRYQPKAERTQRDLF